MKPDPAPPLNPATTCEGVDRWYAPVLLTAGMIGERAVRRETIEKVLALYDRLQPDDYVDTLRRFYREGLDRYGDGWRYCDLVSALLAAAELVRPATYLEIGVRRGRSMAAVAATSPACHLVGFDNWKKGYAGMENPGPKFVEQELRGLGHSGPLDLVTGNSHETVPAYLRAHPDLWADLVTVDGDHSPEGAGADLADVLPRVKIGGAVLFDDISHPAHPELRRVWSSHLGDATRFSMWEYTELGYGVGVGVRKA